MSRTQADPTFSDIRDVIATWQLARSLTMDCLIGRREVCYVVVADIGISTEEEAQSLHSLLERRGNSSNKFHKTSPKPFSGSLHYVPTPQLMPIAEER